MTFDNVARGLAVVVHDTQSHQHRPAYRSHPGNFFYLFVCLVNLWSSKISSLINIALLILLTQVKS
jgi:hypothetical protein